MKNCFPILMNAHAGALHEATGSAQLRRMAQAIGLEVDVIYTQSPHEMSQLLKRLVTQGAERVAVAGGDGTVALAVQTLAHTQTALGILPEGTFNNFATALRLPHNLPAALQTLHEGVVRKVDLGRVGDRYFTEAAGVGLFADALALYGRGTNKNLLRGCYALLSLLAAFRARGVQLIVGVASRLLLRQWPSNLKRHFAASYLSSSVSDRETDKKGDSLAGSLISMTDFSKPAGIVRNNSLVGASPVNP